MLFFDVISVELKEERFKSVEIDPIFIESCSKDSILVVSHSPNKPCVVSAEVIKNKINIEALPVGTYYKDLKINILISGKRKDFEYFRFQEKTKQQYLKNENFWSNISGK